MKRKISMYLDDIVRNIDDAVSYVSDMTYEQFVNDSRTVKAVIRSIEVMGEAAKHIPREIRDESPGIPWRNMTGMRDKCIHDYVGIDHETVWYVVKEDLPLIRPAIAALAERIGKEENAE
jgi:uncharacterized protein with HEPN domain